MCERKNENENSGVDQAGDLVEHEGDDSHQEGEDVRQRALEFCNLELHALEVLAQELVSMLGVLDLLGLRQKRLLVRKTNRQNDRNLPGSRQSGPSLGYRIGMQQERCRVGVVLAVQLLLQGE